jgi:hypothetical protein
VTANSDDDQPTAVASDIDATAVVPESVRTAAAELQSESPTTFVPDVGPTRAAELAWSSEAETEEIADRSHGWRGRVLWLPLVAFLCASVLAAALMAVLWVLFGQTGDRNAGKSQTQSASPTMPLTTAEQTTTSEPTSESATISQPSVNSLPGTDNLGWIGYPAARCDPGNQPAAMARTTQSMLVVCQIQPGSFYYRGVRLSDGASIELANAVRSSVGFDVTNPTDGTRYQIRPTSLTIAPPDAQASSEPMLEYASS